jgi:hypothetical protein
MCRDVPTLVPAVRPRPPLRSQTALPVYIANALGDKQGEPIKELVKGLAPPAPRG